MYKYLSLLFVFCTSCLPADNDPSAEEVIEHTWTLVEERYGLFEDKPNVDWSVEKTNAIKRIKGENERALFDNLSTMLATLEDGHTNLVTPYGVSWDVPRFINGPSLYNRELVLGKVLSWSFAQRGSVIYAKLNNIGYLRLEDFERLPATDTMEAIFKFLAPTDGLIIDLRDNGGGSLDNMFRLLGRLTEQPMDGYQIKFKAGPEQDNFTSTEQRNVAVTSGQRYTKPLAVLTDRRAYSAANTFAFIIKQRANVTLIGQKTGGGGSIPVWFELPNGWKLRLSTNRMTTSDGRAMEAGIEPDITISKADYDASTEEDLLIATAKTTLSP